MHFCLHPDDVAFYLLFAANIIYNMIYRTKTRLVFINEQ